MLVISAVNPTANLGMMIDVAAKFISTPGNGER